MAQSPSPAATTAVSALPPRAAEILSSLVSIASTAANAQIGTFVTRLADLLMQISESSGDGKEASLSFNVANLLKKNSYAYYYLVSVLLEKCLESAVAIAEDPSLLQFHKSDDALSLVSYADVDKTLLLDKVGRTIEIANSDGLAALGVRISHLLGRDDLPLSQNPFRPAIFIEAFHQAWCEFDPDPESHYLMMPLLRPDVFIDLGPIYRALNTELIACGILPDLTESFRIKKSTSAQDIAKKTDGQDAAIVQQLRNLFAPPAAATQSGVTPAAGLADTTFAAGSFGTGFQEHVLEAAVASNKLLGYLAGIQKNGFEEVVSDPASAGHSALQSVLPQIKAQAPQGMMSRVDENTIDLLTKVFDVVFRDQNIPQEIKSLIGFLQVPVLKTALVDKEFFFKEEHPARRVIELLSRSGVGWDQQQGEGDPLYQSIKRNVDRIRHDVDHESTVFIDVIADLESFISEEENQAAAALAAPITQALRQERIGEATKVARSDVAMRIGTGEVVAFVETFLEKKWISVLAIAYTVQDEKPQAVASAVKTMDDLIWSVKPKITVAERKDLIARLPSMLAALNKWLNVVKWEDADRLQFFADLAECHASIVRAPLELSPQRQLEIAIEVAKAAAEKRLQKRTAASAEPAEPAGDEFVDKVRALERGMWLEFSAPDASSKQLKLAWVSPLRGLFIFSTKERQEAFSLTADELAQRFREQRTRQIPLGGLVDRALAEAMASTGANDPVMHASMAG
ncbi:MAG: DUF1631 family protein [Herminiimonas sp.]|nr:DUF1631 family protein [Herminiimonas sp.]